MFLNTLAGRSYNDLTQYPVFPWILQDYTSSSLDLSDPSIYRDLSKPMGPLNSTREATIRQRWKDMFGNFRFSQQAKNSGGGVGGGGGGGGEEAMKPFHYGTHYSSAAVVLYFLLRLEPFTSHFLKDLQGGKFDHGDRTFSSIHTSWLSAAGHINSQSMGDVKELIPEFFFLPEFLLNLNELKFGVQSSTGKRVADVELPPWANECARTFVQIHRKALEHDFVSRNLHKWIDLIFGYKQQGDESIDALNVFFWTSYEGAVKLEELEGSKREVVIDQIFNFGQTPSQLFKKPHPPRSFLPSLFIQNFRECSVLFCDSKLIRCQTLLCGLPFASISSRATSHLSPTSSSDPSSSLDAPISQIYLSFSSSSSSSTPPSSSNTPYKVFVSPPKQLFLPPSFSKYLLYGFSDHSLRCYSSSSNKLLSLCELIHDGPITCLTSTADGKWIVSGGADGVVRVHTEEQMLSSSNNNNNSSNIEGNNSNPNNPSRTSNLSSLTSLEGNGMLYPLVGHKRPVCCVFTSREFSVIISASLDKSIIMWDLNDFTFIRQLVIPTKESQKNEEVRAIQMHPQTGDIFIARGAFLEVFSINGNWLASILTSRKPNGRITCLSVNPVHHFYFDFVVVTGHQSGSIKIWHLSEVGYQKAKEEETKKFKQKGEASPCISFNLHVELLRHQSSVTSVLISNDGMKLYSGDKDGVIVCWSKE